MSGAASKLAPVIATAEPGDAIAPIEGGAPLVESASDSAETLMTYDPNAHVPIVVIAVWACAMLALGAYAFVYFVPDLKQWLH
jgi:hypothetical protein